MKVGLEMFALHFNRYLYMYIFFFSESDTESIPSPSKAQKNTDDAFKIKSLEELKLEQIQKHDAALYQYDQPAEGKAKVSTHMFCLDFKSAP